MDPSHRTRPADRLFYSSPLPALARDLSSAKAWHDVVGQSGSGVSGETTDALAGKEVYRTAGAESSGEIDVGPDVTIGARTGMGDKIANGAGTGSGVAARHENGAAAVAAVD